MEFATIASGSSGNCVYVHVGDTRVLVDVGCPMKQVKAALADFGTDITEIDAILVTHEHNDHVSKVPMLSKRFDIPVYASGRTWENLPFYDDYFPWERHIFEYGMKIGDLDLDFFKLYHDAVEPVGIVMSVDGQRVGVATDTGKVSDAMLRHLNDIDGLVLEANHDRGMVINGPYPGCLKQRILSDHGHLSNEQAGQALCRIIGPHTSHVIMAHLSETNNEPGLALAEVRRLLTAAEIDSSLISVAPRKTAHELICLP